MDVSTDANMTWLAVDANLNVINSTRLGGFGILSGATKNEFFMTSNVTSSNITVLGIYSGPWGSRTTGANLTFTLLLPTPSPTPTPTLTQTAILPAEAFYLSLPTTAVFNLLATFYDGSQKLVTDQTVWTAYNGAGGSPQARVEVSSTGAAVHVTSNFPGSSLVLLGEFQGDSKAASLFQVTSAAGRQVRRAVDALLR